MAGYRQLNTGTLLPCVGYGTGTSFFNRVEDVASCMGQAYSAGYRLFDTAMVYGTEEGVGRGVEDLLNSGVKRKDIFIPTKISPWKCNQIEEYVSESLAKLKVDKIDLVLIHSACLPLDRSKMSEKLRKRITEKDLNDFPSTAEGLSDMRLHMWKTLENLVKEGKIQDIGVSNWTSQHINQLMEASQVTLTPAINQIEFNPYLVDEDILETCAKYKIIVQAYAPLGNGKNMANSHLAGPQDDLKYLLDDPTILSKASKYQATPAQVCLRWALQRGVAVVLKTENKSRMEENLDLQFIIAEEDMGEINALKKVNQRLFGNIYDID